MLSFSNGDVRVAADLAASDLRAEVDDGEQTLGVVSILLGCEDKGHNVLFKF